MWNKGRSATLVRIALSICLSTSFALVVIRRSTDAKGSGEQNKQSLTSTANRNTDPASAKTMSAYGNLSLAFAPNMGQFDPRVRYASQAANASIYFTPNEIQLVLGKKPSRVGLQLSFIGANPSPVILSSGPLGTVNYLIGNDPAQWHTGIKSYTAIVYKNLWPGIDLKFFGHSGTLKYEFHVAPEADPRKIQLRYAGIEQLSVATDGSLRVKTSLGVLHDSRPFSYQEIDGKRVSVASQYSLKEKNYGIAVHGYDSSRPLIIDPSLTYSTFLGGGQADVGLGIVVDGSGSAYITGETGASNFPTTVGAFDETFNGGTALGRGDVFVTKLNPSGTAIEYSTYIGGAANDLGEAIAVDANGNAYVTGWTASTDFPTTPGAFDTTDNTGTDAFLTKLNPSGTALLYSSYLGGSLSGVLGGSAGDFGAGIAVDEEGNAYVAGSTDSRDFPTTTGAFDVSYTAGAGSHVFVTKINASGSALIYSTYLGGATGETAAGIAIDTSGNAFITGTTRSATFPTTAGAYDTTPFFGTQEVFVTKLNADGAGLIYSTFLGGSASDQGTDIAIDEAGNAYITGWGNSLNFPTTPGAFDTMGDSGEVFVSKLNTDGATLLYSTYLGGSSNDNSWAIAVDTSGNAFVTGITSSSDFPTTFGAFDSTLSGVTDAFLTKLNVTGTSVLYSTLLGGFNSEDGRALATTAPSTVYLTGRTTSSNFATTAGSFQPTIGGGIGGDAFILKLTNQPPVAADDTVSTDEDVSVNINSLSNDTDADGDTLVIAETTQGANGSVTINPDNTVTYLPKANFNGSDSFTYEVVDTWGDTATAIVNVTVNPVNDAPVASDVSSATDEDQSVEINFVAADVDSGNLTFVVVDPPANGMLGPITNGSISYTPNSNFNGSDSFTFKANDGLADSNVATVAITIAPVNDAPDAIDDSVSTSEETPITVAVRANDIDPDGEVLTITNVSEGTHGSVVISNDGTTVTYTPVLNFFGTDSFTYNVSDGRGGTDTAAVNVTVTNVQDAPTANDDTATVAEDSTNNFIQVLGNDLDVDGNTLAVASVTQAGHGVVVNNGNSVSYTPNANYRGPDSFSYTITDGEGGSDSATINITVTNVNDAPFATADSYSTNANTTLVITSPGVLVNDLDVDSDALSATLVTDVSNGTLLLAADGSFTYTPNLNFFGSDSFSYLSSDGTATSNIVSVDISVGNNLIVFSSTRDGNAEIYSMGIDGISVTRITNDPATDVFPVWSPDKTRIAFNSNREGSFEVYLMNSDGSGLVRLTTSALVEGPVSWSPDGTRIAFSSKRDGNPEIYLMNADGTGQQRLTKQRGIDIKPSWSPDGAKIVFSSDRKRSFEIYVMNADGTDVIQLTKNSFTDVSPAWSADGAKIAFSSNRDGNFEIYTMNPDGSGLVRLTMSSGADEEPAWFDDASKILFTSQRDGNAEIYLMHADGSGQTRLTTNAAADTSPN